MVAKISVGNSLYGALAYNGEKINKEEGRLLTTNRIYNDGTGTVDIRRAMEDFLALMPVRSKVEKPVVHISLNPHPDDMLTDTELQDIAREYLEKMGFGNQPYMVYKHEDIDRHHLHIVTVRVDGDGRSIDTRNNFYRSKQITRELERKYGLHDAERKSRRTDMPLHKVATCADGNIMGWSIPLRTTVATRSAILSSPRSSGSPSAMMPYRESSPVQKRKSRTENSPT